MVLARDFYRRPTLEVARDLLGKTLIREFESGERLVGEIVEVEAYDGPEDRACHSAHGRTARTEVVFGPAGYAYVYLVYGLHHCLNIVTEKPGAAVLIRALKPFFIKLTTEEVGITSGPGKLCRWMRIDRSLNGWDLTRGEQLWLEEGSGERLEIASSPRIGISYAGEWAAKPWRLYLKGSPFVSR